MKKAIDKLNKVAELLYNDWLNERDFGKAEKIAKRLELVNDALEELEEE